MGSEAITTEAFLPYHLTLLLATQPKQTSNLVETPFPQAF